MGYAFISYSTANQDAADAVRTLFHKNGIEAWMAPYDIPAGCEYAEVIADALAGCACLVLVLTAVRAYTGTTPTKPKSTEKEDAVLVDPWECYRRGYCFELGEGTPVDYEQAGYWYEMGASQGNAWCQHRMGEFFLLGRGRAQDFSEAVKWYMRGAVQKDHSSCERLAQCYENGWGIERDLHLANVWRKRAIQYKK